MNADAGVRRRKVKTAYAKRKEKLEARGIYSRKFPRQFESDVHEGWVYVIHNGGNSWDVGATRDILRRMKERKWPNVVGLIECPTATKAFTIETEFHEWPEPWNRTVLQFLVWYFGGIWNEGETRK